MAYNGGVMGEDRQEENSEEANQMVQADSPYPVQFNVAYPDSPRNRLTALFRIILVIPIIIVLWQVSGGSAAAGGILVLSPLLMILFRRKYPGGGSIGTWHF